MPRIHKTTRQWQRLNHRDRLWSSVRPCKQFEGSYWERPQALLPKGRVILFQRWAVLTRNSARFVPVMALYFWLCLATSATDINLFGLANVSNLGCCTSHTHVLHIPIAHLFQIRPLFFLIRGPTHVKNDGVRISLYNILHVLFSRLKLIAIRKLLHVAIPRLDMQSSPGRMLI